MKTTLPLLKLLLVLLVLQVPTLLKAQEVLTAPSYATWGFPIYENEIIFGFFNPNEDSQTEVYIALAPVEGEHHTPDFTLAYVADPGETVYFDSTRSPRTTYEFKLRAIRDNLTSSFSETIAFRTGSKFYPPVLRAEATGPHTISLSITDRSWNDRSFDVWREERNTAKYLGNVSSLDSGRVFTITDDGLLENTTYSYRVDAYSEGPNNPLRTNVAQASASTSGFPMVNGFTLIDPETDQAVMELYDHEIISETERFNIRADVNAETSSVVFNVNGVKRTENEAPYALFLDTKGDYKPGTLKEGDYTLEATAYSGNNGQGLKGNTWRVEFSVVNDYLKVLGFTLVHPDTDEDMAELKDGDVVNASEAPNIRANTGPEASSVVFSLNGVKRTENEAPYAYYHDTNGDYRPGRLQPGSYTLEATAYTKNNAAGERGETLRIAFTVIEDIQQRSSASINLYPNPVIATAVIEVTGKAGSNVTMQTVNQDVQHPAMTWQRSLNDTGYLKQEFDTNGLSKGTYILRIEIDGEVMIQRFSIR